MEVLVASSLGTLLLAALASTFLFCLTMFRNTMAEVEMTLALRDLRDKLLFRAGPGLNEGLLTGSVSTEGNALKVNWTTDETGTGNGPDKIRLLLSSDSGGNYIFNDKLGESDINKRWFCSPAFRLRDDWSATVDLPRIRLDLGSTRVGQVHDTAWILLPSQGQSPK